MMRLATTTTTTLLLLLCAVVACCAGAAICPLHAVNAAAYLEAPQARPVVGLANVCPDQKQTCCTQLGLSSVLGRNDSMSELFQRRLSQVSSRCLATLDRFACAACSPDQGADFHVYEYETHLALCQVFADQIHSDCWDATLNDLSSVTVAQHFSTGAGLVQHLLQNLFSVSVSSRGWRCYNPLARPCTFADFTGYYTECQYSAQYPGGVRSAFFLMSNPNSCNGGVQPEPVHNLSCSIACQEGFYLPVGRDRCEYCPAGTFSLGGGQRIQTWKEWPSGLMARSYCIRTDGGALIEASQCHPWLMNETNVHSGAIKDSQVSVLEINVELVRPGSVMFDWQVEAEQCTNMVCDGFYFEIDGVRKINVTSIAPLTRSDFALSAGVHTLLFAFRKDVSISQGADRAEIFWLEVEGIFWADSSCTPCPHGTFSTLGSTECSPCPADSATNEIGTPNECPACAPSQYAFAGATQCTSRPPCTIADAEALYWEWIEPHVCQGGYMLPANRTGLACPDCQPGFRRLPGYGECVGCPDGQRVSPTDSSMCLPCPEGTYANKMFEVDTWDAWPDWSHHVTMIPLSATLQHGCDGRGCQSDWRLMGSFVDSGVMHRFPAMPYLNFTVDVETVPTVFRLGVSFQCPDQICQAVVRDYVHRNGTLEYVDTLWLTSSFFDDSHPGELPIREAGVHSLVVLFDGFLPFFGGQGGGDNGTYVAGSMRVRSLQLNGARDGSASQCEPCAPGSAAPAAQDTCVLCPPGTFSAGNQSSCSTCAGDSFTSAAGQPSCVACGAGTVANAAHTDCTSTCVFEAGRGLTYDLRPLMSPDMYGPIVDPNNHRYYMSVCDKTDRKHACHDEDGKPITSFLCQTNDQGVGYNIGDLMAFVPEPESPRNRAGFNLTFSHGDKCGNGKVRHVTVVFRCDPEAGLGHPDVPHGRSDVEYEVCEYELVWATLYACPVCTTDDYTALVGDCDAGSNTQPVTYAWKTQPKRCHSGVALPLPAVQPCSASTVSCAPGQYAAGGACAAAPAGSYSVGDGERVQVGERGTLPFGFSAGCTVVGCSAWAADRDRTDLRSGLRHSWLRASKTYVADGSITFEYKFGGRTRLDFKVDGDVLLSVQTTMLAYESASFNMSKGLHTFEWLLHDGSAATESERERAAYVRNVTFWHSRLAQNTPVPCPAGFHQPQAGQSHCIRCPTNTHSDVGASVCAPCEGNTFSMPGENKCEGMKPCSVNADYQPYFTPCIGGKRNQTWERLLPVHCAVTGPDNELPAPATDLTCVTGDCALGFFLNEFGTCTTCPPGNGVGGPTHQSCLPVQAGSAAVPVMAYFDGFQPSSAWPYGWSTRCSGACGTAGWRARADMMDSGFHDREEVDSTATLVQTWVTPGSLEFDFTVTAGLDGLDFFVDGMHTDLFRPQRSGQRLSWQHVVFHVEAGQHTFVWAYHQSSGNEGAVQVRSVMLRGVEGGGREVQTCPAGTYSADMARWCQPCPAGTASAEAGSAVCMPCAPGTFQAHTGQAACHACMSATSAAGATFCPSSCVYSDKGRVWDFSALSSPIGPVQSPLPELDESYYVQLCQPMEDKAFCNNSFGDPVTTHVCEIDPSTQFGKSGGVVVSTEVVQDNLVMTFTGGSADGCAPDEVRTTRIINVCDQYAALLAGTAALPAGRLAPKLSLAFADGPCKRTFTLQSYEGCRLCDNSTASVDYTASVSACEAGVVTYSYHKSAVCKGDVLRLVTAPCDVPYTFPLPAVAAILGVLGIAAVGIGVLIWRNRRIHRDYRSLLEQRAGSELTGMSSSFSLESSVDSEKAAVPSANDIL